MSVLFSMAIFFVIWWTVLFVTLPFGVKSQHEGDDIVVGSEPGAPIRPLMMKKAIWTTGISIVIFLIIRFYGSAILKILL